jgi:23S rRNA (uracil1939-C5)-methyltransferase
LRIPAGAFAQVGVAANQALITAVLEQVGETPGSVLELYAGSANLTRFLLNRATRVSACEGDPAAVSRGRRTAPAASWSNHPPRLVDADTVVVDPPRGGLDAANFAAVLQAKRRVVYVSCDPQTLGRDAARLAQNGFVLRGAVALDLMPHTYHVEVVATFDREQP